MRARRRSILTLLVIAITFAAIGLTSRIRPRASAAPVVSASMVAAGCYLVTPSTCKIHVNPFWIAVEPGQTLEEFQIQANGQPIYHFRTDTSNPPSGDYFPSLVKQDFAAHCSQTYTVALLARDTSDLDLQVVGTTGPFTCPKGAYWSFLPIVKR